MSDKENEILCESCDSNEVEDTCNDCKNNFCEDCLELCNYCNLYFCRDCDELEYISSTGQEEDYENDNDRMFCIKCIKNHYSELAPWDK